MAYFNVRCSDEQARSWHRKAAWAGTNLSALVRQLLEWFDPSGKQVRIEVAFRSSPEVIEEGLKRADRVAEQMTPKPDHVVEVPAILQGRVDPKAGWCARCRRIGAASCRACEALVWEIGSGDDRVGAIRGGNEGVEKDAPSSFVNGHEVGIRQPGEEGGVGVGEELPGDVEEPAGVHGADGADGERVVGGGEGGAGAGGGATEYGGAGEIPF